MKRNSALLLFLLLLLIIPLSCDREMVYDQYMTVEEDGWLWNDKKEFEVLLEDTISLHNIYIQVRHSTLYPLSNLYMFIHVDGPAGQSISDTVNYMLAEPDGRWLGIGRNIKEIRLLYRKNTIFNEPGIYYFTVEQGMRNPSLPISEVGLRIESVSQ